jgi:hypothetical protein
LGHEQAAYARSPPVGSHDHSYQPGRAIPPFFDIVFGETYRAERIASLIKRDPCDRQTVAASFVGCNIDPPRLVIRLRRVAPLLPSHLTDVDY